MPKTTKSSAYLVDKNSFPRKFSKPARARFARAGDIGDPWGNPSSVSYSTFSSRKPAFKNDSKILLSIQTLSNNQSWETESKNLLISAFKMKRRVAVTDANVKNKYEAQSCKLLPTLKPYARLHDTSSTIGSIANKNKVWTARSNTVGIPRGLLDFPFSLEM